MCLGQHLYEETVTGAQTHAHSAKSGREQGPGVQLTFSGEPFLLVCTFKASQVTLQRVEGREAWAIHPRLCEATANSEKMCGTVMRPEPRPVRQLRTEHRPGCSSLGPLDNLQQPLPVPVKYRAASEKPEPSAGVQTPCSCFSPAAPLPLPRAHPKPEASC